MKKQLIGFILSLLICVLTPLEAVAGFTMVMTTSPWPIAPGGGVGITVQVKEDNNPVEGETVTFSVSPDDGTASLNPTSSTTDSDGKVRTTLSVGSDASGSYTVTATRGSQSVSGTVTVETTDPDPEFSISAVSTTTWTGAPGDSFTFTVQVREDGSPAQGETVTFSVSPDDGAASLNSTSATTGSNGQASTTLTLGSSASGSYTVTATRGSQSVSGTATVETTDPDPEFSISAVSTTTWTGAPGDSFAFTVQVQEDGSSAQGETVTFSVSPDDGTASLNSTSATTGSNGQASTTLTLGSSASGSYTVTATHGSQSVSGTVTVETTDPDPEFSISAVANTFWTGAPGDSFTFTVQVREDGSPAQGETVTFSVSPDDGAASLNSTSATTDSNGQASTTLSVGSDASGSYTVTATHGSQSVSGTATVETTPPPAGFSMVMTHSPWPIAPGGGMGFTVQVQEDGSPAQGETVTFSVSPDDGTASLSSTSATTDSNGQASTTLSVGSDASGSYTVTATHGSQSVSGTATVETSAQQRDNPPEKTVQVSTVLPPQTLETSGEDQQGPAGTILDEPFVVTVRDQNGDLLEGTQVTFAVTAGGGTLSATTATTDANGQAATTLTLGSEPGTNTVSAIVKGLESVTFTAVGHATPHSLEKVSGDEQEGPISTQLAAPLVVLALDEDGEAVAGVVVSFSVTAGGGLLSSSTSDSNPCTIESSKSSTTATTDANGRAAIRLTLGSEPGTNTVEATVAGESEPFTATATEQATPHSMTKVCGDDQEGTAGTLLDEPFVVSVSDEDGAAMAGVVVSFSVTTGGGTLLAATATTDVNGRARTWLTLGSELGTNTVEATVEGLEPVTFTATGQEDPLASILDTFGGRGKLVGLPDSPQLAQNAPNPFNSQTILSYFLLEPGPTRLEVFTLTGQLVAVLHQGPQQAGYHRLRWDGRDAAGHPLASGIYLYRLVTDQVVLTRKLTLLR